MRRSLTSWEGISEALPDGIAELLPVALAHVEARLAPVEPHVLAGLMQRMWDAGVPQPHPTTLAEWRRLLSPYPADVLAAAFDQVARTHRWPDPPKIADVVRWIGEEMTRLSDWRHRLQQAQLRARLDAKGRADEDARRARIARWRSNLSPEDQDALARVRSRLAAGESAASIVAESIGGAA
ncbi:hypothetical protein [Magnetospirillum fulvum]|uniref:Uncharacterized protein n=1 Tax=Magnetospirillum fulvum MGU-K5 TaxID=1316936 RepID=S9TMK5_MAGFU|nr:hypothetical protein [Magnetospirillum fulvum]EPY03506.1 hypothetical protein K678_00305 [Magnetospirillum fulvum MGU-K5]